MSSTPPLRVLYVENDPHDRQLVLERLAGAPQGFTLVTVDTLAGFREALATRSFDVVLSDFHLGTFDGIEVLETLRATCPGVPLVFVTITGSEEIAVRALKAGAADYVLKTPSHLRRLPHVLVDAVHRTLVAQQRDREIDERVQRDRRMTAQQATLLRLGAIRSDSVDYRDDIRRITEEAAACLQLERVSVWRYNDDRSAIHCMDLWERTRRLHSTGTTLAAKDYPVYFKALAESEVIAAADAMQDARTREFARDYIPATGVAAMLDVPIRLSGSRAGVLCHEHVGAVRTWHPDEESFAVSVGNLVALAVERAERRAALEALRRSHTEFQLLFASNPLPMWVFDRETLRFLTINDAAIAQYGYTREEFAHMTIRDIRPAEDIPRLEAALLRRSEGFQQANIYRHRRKDGSIIHVRISGHALEFAGRPAELILAQDVTSARQAEIALQESEARFRQMADHAPVIVWVTDANGECTFVGKSWYEFTGQREPEGLGQGWTRAVHPEDLPAVASEFRAAREALRTFRAEYRLHRADGAWRWVISAAMPRRDDEGRFLGYIGSVLDIQDRRSLEEQLRQSQKMEAMGQLAAGVAHDFNNLLAVIKGHAGLVRLRSGLPADMAESIGQISQAADRAADLTRRLLTFSRQQAISLKMHDLNDLVAHAAKLLQRLVGEDIRLEITRSAEPLPVRADAGMVEQVLLNLVVNARDAMPRGGMIRILAGATKVDAAQAVGTPGARAGDFACLAVSDTGSGIPAHLLPRIFEPFFTTKPVGQGTGLGLATVYGVMVQHGGWVAVQSEVGQGTTFRAFFPRQQTAAPAPERAAPTVVKGGSETILLVEDEPAVRAVTRTALETLGYRVIAASNGREALGIWESRRAEIDLVFTDAVMPEGVSGVELLERVRQDRPDIHLLLTTGYAKPSVGTGDEIGVDVLRKPYELTELAKAVRTALGQPVPRGA